MKPSSRIAYKLLMLMLAGVVLSPAQAQTSRLNLEALNAIQAGKYETLSPEMQQSIQSGAGSAAAIGKRSLDSRTSEAARAGAADFARQAQEAFIAAVPPRDKARAQAVFGKTQGSSTGRLYYFVSRSMPNSLLKAYAADAFQTGASLVVKGVRKGDSLKEYFEEAMENFNSSKGQALAQMEINPNMFDMFGVDVVPAIVWTSKTDLSQPGSGCDAPAGPPTMILLSGPNDEPVEVEQQLCAKADPASFYKLAGALNTSYVLDSFQEAGAPQAAMDFYRGKLAQRTGNVNEASTGPVLGKSMAPLTTEYQWDRPPEHVLMTWAKALQGSRVQRGPYGPVFNTELEDDPVYREELLKQIERGLSGASQ